MNTLRLSVRALFTRPAFTLAAVLTLAIGIGANTAVFTVVNAVLLAPLPYANPDAVVVLNEVVPSFPAPISVSYQNYVDWRNRSQSFDSVAAFRTTQMTMTGLAEAERLTVRQVTATLLPTLGVQVPVGRGITEADDKPGAPGVAVLSHGFWTRRFGASGDVLGQPLNLDLRPYTIVGVLPPDFELFQNADIYLAMEPWAATLPDDRGWHPGILPVARLKHGVTIEQAQGDMDRVSRALEDEYPQSNRAVRAAVTRLSDQVVQNVRPALLMLSGAVCLVLLIACANVANLLLARSIDRQKEIAVRTALGAGRARLLRQLVIESVVLSCAGGLAGVLLAAWGVSFLTQLAAGLPRTANVELDLGVLTFALGLSVLTGIVFGLAPAVQATRLDIREALNEESRAAGSGGVRHSRMRSALVVAEVALALVLLVGAGLLLRSFSALQRVNAGFDPANLLVVDLPLSPVTYRDDLARTTMIDRALDRVRALPGVRAVAVGTALPMSGAAATIHFNIAGKPPKGPEDYKLAGYRAVTPGYFEALGIPLRRGRTFTDRDRQGAPAVAVINESMARQYFADVSPIGQRFAIGTEPDAESPFFEIVGVVGDVRQSFEAGAKAEYYLPYGQYPHPVLAALYRNVSLAIRASAHPTMIAPAVRSTLREIDADQPLVKMRTMDQAMAETIAQPRLRTVLLAIFAGVAVLLAVSGVYGVMAYTVLQRTQEIGVRVALGASADEIVRMVAWQGARLAAAGVAIGTAGAAIATRALEGMLFEMRGLDPLTFAGAAALLGTAAVFACYVPARRAAAVPPIIALRLGS